MTRIIDMTAFGQTTQFPGFAQGESVEYDIACKDPITLLPLDLTGSNVIMSIGALNALGQPILNTVLSRQATIVNPPTAGNVKVPFAPQDTVPAILGPIPATTYKADLIQTDSSGNRLALLATGTLVISAAVTLPGALVTPLPAQLPLALGPPGPAGPAGPQGPSGWPGLNVKDYGALGDGIADDTAAIQAAITAAAATVHGVYGSHIFFPKGTYLISATLPLPNGVGLLGDGLASTTIRAMPAFNAQSMIKNSAQDGTQEFAWLQSLIVDANKGSGAIVSKAAVDFVSLFVDSYIRDVVITSSSSVGLHIAAGVAGAGGGGPFHIANLWVLQCNSDNVLIEEVAGDAGTFESIVAYGITSEHQASGFAAIRLKGLGKTSNIALHNIHIEMVNTGGGTTGITIDGVSNVLIDNVALNAGVPGSIVGILITNAVQNNNIQIRGVQNPNLIIPVIKDVKNNISFGAVNVPFYATPEIGLWPTTEQTLAYGATVNTDLSKGNDCILVVSDGNPFTIANPTFGPVGGVPVTTGQRLTFEIVNATGGAMGAITWGSEFAFRDPAFASPTSGKRRLVTFRRRSGNNWIQEATTGDM